MTNEFASRACSRFPGHAYPFKAVSVKDDNRDENCCDGPDEHAISLPGPHSSLPDILPVRNGTANGQQEKQCENLLKRIKHRAEAVRTAKLGLSASKNQPP